MAQINTYLNFTGKTEEAFKASWGAWFGMLVDKFGVQWMINFEDSTT